MIISENWLREWVNPEINSSQLFEQLTMVGLEVKTVEPASARLEKVIVGELLAVEPHPEADKLSLCQVSNGKNTVEVVCGASNARQGLKVAFAQIGAALPGLKVKKVKIRGAESYGMLCSASELGIAEISEGIIELPADAPSGTSIYEYLGLDDNLIELELTPNRGDCISLAGVAREVSAINNVDLKDASGKIIKATIEDDFPDRKSVV